MQYNKRPFVYLEGTSCNLTILWLVGKSGNINIGELIDMRYASPHSVYRALDQLIIAGLVERTLGTNSTKPLRLTEKGKVLYNGCILKAFEILQQSQ